MLCLFTVGKTKKQVEVKNLITLIYFHNLSKYLSPEASLGPSQTSVMKYFAEITLFRRYLLSQKVSS